MGDPAGTNPTADAAAAIENLVERFERNIDAYRQGKYNETLVRREFIDPMFAALGWDIDNRAGYAEAYKDVIHEDAIKVGERPRLFATRLRRWLRRGRPDSTDCTDAKAHGHESRVVIWSAVTRHRFGMSRSDGYRRRQLPKTSCQFPCRRAKALPQAKTDHDKTLLQRQITTTDHQIDQLVYELYGLSDDEIAIVEGVA